VRPSRLRPAAIHLAGRIHRIWATRARCWQVHLARCFRRPGRFVPGALDSPRAERPADLDETAPVFLRLEGTLIGPSYYGFEAREEYLLTVERILELRAPAQRYCQGSTK
jgi:hypothetical protein